MSYYDDTAAITYFILQCDIDIYIYIYILYYALNILLIQDYHSTQYYDSTIRTIIVLLRLLLLLLLTMSIAITITIAIAIL